MAIEIGFTHQKWWIFPVRYVNVYQRVSYLPNMKSPTIGSVHVGMDGIG